MMIRTLNRSLPAFILGAILLWSCTDANKKNSDDQENNESVSTDSLLTRIQQQTFRYFWEGAEPTSGLARERIHMDGEYPLNDQNVVTIGGSGFGVMGIIVAMERGFISKAEGQKRLDHIMDYLANAERFKGAFAHWYQGETGKAKAFGDRDDGGDIVETAFMAQALITVREYYKNGNEQQQAIAQKADQLWQDINWNHYTNGDQVLYWHWSPTHDFAMKHPIMGFDECLIAYVLAVSSPTYPIDPSLYDEGWARSGEIRSAATKYGIPVGIKHNAHEGEVGPLFWQHYSFLGLNPHGLRDQYANYWDVAVNHTKINIAHAEENPNNYEGYGKDKGWGWTASYSVSGYQAHHPDNDHGVISPTAALSSMPYAPDESISFARYLFDKLEDKVWGEYGFYDAYSESEGWFPQRYLAIDQGPIVVMIENHRTGLIWDLFMQAPEVQEGLKKIGFESPNIK